MNDNEDEVNAKVNELLSKLNTLVEEEEMKMNINDLYE
jgi:hypothetical protein